jgi:hypothetical protein
MKPQASRLRMTAVSSVVVVLFMGNAAQAVTPGKINARLTSRDDAPDRVIIERLSDHESYSVTVHPTRSRTWGTSPSVRRRSFR